MTDSWQAYLTGYLYGSVNNENGFLGIDKMETLTDEEGNYFPEFLVHLKSGKTLRVSVAVD